MGLGIIGWIVLGLIAGFIASKVVNNQGEGVLVDIILGIVGSVVGGFIFNSLGMLSLLLCVATVVLWVRSYRVRDSVAWVGGPRESDGFSANAPTVRADGPANSRWTASPSTPARPC